MRARIFVACFIAVVASSACGVDEVSDIDSQASNAEVVSTDAQSGLSTIFVPAAAFNEALSPSPMSLETTRLAISSGSVWQTAAVSVTCPSLAMFSVRVCAQEYNLATPLTSMQWCAHTTSCRGPNPTTLTIPMPPVTEDATHSLRLSLQRNSTGVVINSAALTAVVNGDEVIVQ